MVDKGGFATGAVVLNQVARFGEWGAVHLMGGCTVALQLRYGGRELGGKYRDGW